MDNKSITRHEHSSKQVVADIDIDKFFESEEVWKPLTDGLGFKDGTEEIEEAKNPVHNAVKANLQTQIQTKTLNTDPKFDRGDLAPFYTEVAQEEIELDKPVKKTVSIKYVEADPIARFFAWTIDMIFILSLVAVTFVIVHFSTGSILDANANSIINYYLYELIIPSFCMFYLFYFTVLDRTSQSTIGKNLLNLTVKSDKPANILITLRRSIISLASLPLAFIPMVLGLHNKFTGTKVVKAHGRY